MIAFRADVFVAAFSTTQDPRMRVGFRLLTTRPISRLVSFEDLDSNNIAIKNGMARYAVPASQPKA